MDLSQFTRSGKYLMLALDQRGSFRKAINPQNPDLVTDQEIIDLKHQIIEAVKGQFSAILVDKAWGFEAFDKSKPFLLPIEKSGYIDTQGERLVSLEYTPLQLKSFGAAGAKLLLYFNPDQKNATSQIEVGRKIMQECKDLKLPFFLEIVTYHPSGEPIVDKSKIVLDSLNLFIKFGVVPDVWKLEYPGSKEGCEEITRLVGQTPWILLTAGAKFEVFKQRLADASKAGASGFLAGRALWQEACGLRGEERAVFLETVYPRRFQEIVNQFS